MLSYSKSSAFFINGCSIHALILYLSASKRIRTRLCSNQETMSLECVGFRKKLVRTHHSMLCLPKEFCEAHLPFHNDNVVLVDESEREYNVKYVVKKRNQRVFRLGWRDFAVARGLQEGDTVVFYLIDECKFKVRIIRSSRSIENEFQNNKPVDPVILKDLMEENARTVNTATEKMFPVSCAVDSHQENMLCRIKKRVHEEVVPKGKKHLKVALSPQCIKFCKIIHRSHLSKHSLRLPMKFCEAHLPRHDTTIILVDENHREYNVNYKVKRTEFLGGWRDFARAHGLLEGDTLVFQLIDPCKFKVQIIRASRPIRNVLKNNMPVDFVKREDLIEENAYTGNTATQNKHPVSRSVDGHQNDIMLCRPNKIVHEERIPIEKVYIRRKHRSAETSDAYVIHSAAPLGFDNSESSLSFKGFEDFKICVNGKMLDSEIPEHIRIKYFELCCVEKRLLHDHVKEEVNSKLVVSMILDVVGIAESTKATSISTRVCHLKGMDRTLKSFEDLGMTLGSLRSKIGKLVKILNEHHSVAESTIVKLEAIECEKKVFMEEKKKIDELIESTMIRGKMIGCLEENVDGSKEKMDKLSLMLKEIAGLSQ